MPDTPLAQTPPAVSAEIARILEQGRAFVSAGDFRHAIDYVTEANRDIRDAGLERQLVLWRAGAFPTLSQVAPASWPPRYADPFPGHVGLPEIDAHDLTAEVIGAAFQHHGPLLVRGLLSQDESAHLRNGIDQALQARTAFFNHDEGSDTSAWYAEAPLETDTAQMRGWTGGVWTADSPRMLYDLLDLYERRGLLDLLRTYLQETLTLSIGKSTLRLVPPEGRHDWHQDGAFLGKDVRTVNVWLSLSDCGVDAPGLDIVAKSLPSVVETGTHGAQFKWTVGHGMVEILEQQGAPVVSPVFRPGDALLFNQLMLHRTAVRDEMNRSRYAIESWFFTPSTFPHEQGPLLV